MTYSIASNIVAQKVVRAQSRASSDLSSVSERLASGQRINKASDDAAGLSISDSLRARRRIYNQAVRNLNDGISVMNIADGAMDQLGTIATRIIELSEQGANRVYAPAQRESLDIEAQSLANEFDRITESVDFNGVKLLNGAENEIRLQASLGLDGSLVVRLPEISQMGAGVGRQALSSSAPLGRLACRLPRTSFVSQKV